MNQHQQAYLHQKSEKRTCKSDGFLEAFNFSKLGILTKKIKNPSVQEVWYLDDVEFDTYQRGNWRSIHGHDAPKTCRIAIFCLLCWWFFTDSTMGFIIIKTHHHLGAYFFELFKHRTSKSKSNLGGGFEYVFHAHPYLGKIPILTIYVICLQMGWNVQTTNWYV